MDEQRKYEVIKGLVDHPDTANKDRAALILLCTPEYPSDTCLNRFLPSICQMLKRDPADPNNQKETVVNILVLNYNKY